VLSYRHRRLASRCNRARPASPSRHRQFVVPPRAAAPRSNPVAIRCPARERRPAPHRQPIDRGQQRPVLLPGGLVDLRVDGQQRVEPIAVLVQVGQVGLHPAPGHGGRLQLGDRNNAVNSRRCRGKHVCQRRPLLHRIRGALLPDGSSARTTVRSACDTSAPNPRARVSHRSAAIRDHGPRNPSANSRANPAIRSPSSPIAAPAGWRYSGGAISALTTTPTAAPTIASNTRAPASCPPPPTSSTSIALIGTSNRCGPSRSSRPTTRDAATTAPRLHHV
jgi:hypothetical protein